MVQNNFCKRCDQQKDESEFYYNSQGYRSSPNCKGCNAEIKEEKKQKDKVRKNENGEELFSFGREAKFYNYQKTW